MGGVSDALKRARKAKRWTQLELAERSGVSQQAISFIENGRNSPSESTIRLLADALGLSVSDLLHDESETETTLKPDELRLLNMYRSLPANAKEAALENVRTLCELFSRGEDRRPLEISNG